ncbi:MAG: hypothetical protein RL263_1228 [Bacteroidota bacterium]
MILGKEISNKRNGSNTDPFVQYLQDGVSGARSAESNRQGVTVKSLVVNVQKP